jgi:hypothetical protein
MVGWLVPTILPNKINMVKNSKSNAQSKRAKPRSAAKRAGKAAAGARSKQPNRRSAQVQHLVKHGLNAFSTVHIPLPVSTGRYHTVRTVKVFATTDYLTLLAPARTEHGDWRTIVAYSYPLSTALLNGATVTTRTSENPFSGSVNDTECVPAAFSVQASCNTSLLNAAGVTYIGRMKTGYTAPAPTDARTAAELANALLSYAPMRMVSNAELVSSPKQVSAIPTNTTELAEFTPINDDNDVVGTNWSSANHGFAGFAPIVIINPTGAALQLSVGTEWRVRVDPFNPMHATGNLHPPAPASLWHAINSAAESAGHGVEEVAGVAAGAYALSQTGGFAGIMETMGSMAARALPFLESAAPLLLL